jgi:hypothetical protein
MGLGSSQRRKWLRVQLHVNRKLTAIRWIGQVSVGEMRIRVRCADVHIDREKADKGAEKSFRTRGSRGRRIGKCRRGGLKREKVNLAAVKNPRPQAEHTVRKSSRHDRAQAWMEATSLKFYDLILKTKFSESYDWKRSPLVHSFGAFRLQVELISSLPKPISFGIFRRQCMMDSPWGSDPDICCKIIPVHDLEWHLLDSNISIPAPREQPYRGFVVIGSAKKKTLATLCMRCGRRTPGIESCTDCPKSGGQSSKTPARNRGGRGGRGKGVVRRCGCKVGAKCPH